MKYCSVEGCSRPHHANGYCTKHNHQIERHGRITPERERSVYSTDSKCSVSGCDNRPKNNGLCNRHYLQVRRFGKILARTTKDKNEIQIHGDYAEMYLYDHEKNIIATTIIDIEDVDKVRGTKWGIRKNKKLAYVDSKKLGKLHRYLINAPSGKVVDHIDRNPLNNRKTNLRICTQSDNAKNVGLRENTITGVKGIYRDKKKGRFHAAICVNKKKIYIGASENLNEAARMRRSAELKYFGEFATKEEFL